MAKKRGKRTPKAAGPVPDAVADVVPEVVPNETIFTVAPVAGFPAMTTDEAMIVIDDTIQESGELFESLETTAQTAVDRLLTPMMAESGVLNVQARDAVTAAMDPLMDITTDLLSTGTNKADAAVAELRTIIEPQPIHKPLMPSGKPQPGMFDVPFDQDTFDRFMACVPPFEKLQTEVKFLKSSFTQFAANWWHDLAHLTSRERYDGAFGNQACMVGMMVRMGWLTQDFLDQTWPGDAPQVNEVIESALRYPGLWCDACDDQGAPVDKPPDEVCPPLPCGVQEIVDAIEGIGNNAPEDCKLQLWKNCKTGDLKIVMEGTDVNGRGEDWVLIESLADGVQIAAKMMEEACKKEDEDDEDDERQLEVEGLAVDGAVNCKVPLAVFFKVDLYDRISDALSKVAATAGGFTIAKAITGLINGGAPQSLPVLIASLIVHGGIWLTRNAARRLCKDNEDQLVAKIGTRALYGFFNNIIPGGFDEAITALDQQIKIDCAKKLPTAGEAVAAFMADEINKTTLQCWVTANGLSWAEYEKVVLASRTKLGVAELITALNRKLINQEQYDSEIRELGYIQDGDAKLLHDLNEFVPGPGDIVRFMQRDVDDAAIVQKFGLDSEFNAKFAGLTKQLADDQQIPEETMKRYWRAHWDIPSPSMLIEMFFRTQNLPAGHADKVEWNDVETALKQQDILPFWIDKFRIISQRLLTRVDTRRAFEIGVLTQDQVIMNYRRSGYAESDAKTLAEFFMRRKVDLLTRHPVSKQYVNGGVSTPQLITALAEFGLPRPQQTKLIDKLKQQAQFKAVSACVKALHRRFMLGDLDPLQADQALSTLNTDGDIRHFLIEQWKCEKAARGKQASVATLCKWYEDGRITIREWYDRLINLGWDDEDALRLIADCNLKISERQEAERQKKLKELQAEERRRQAEQEKEAKRAKKILDQNRKKAEQMRKSREAIQRRNTTSAKDLANKLGIEIEDAVQAVSGAWRLLRTEVPMSEDQASRILASIVKLKSITDLATFQADALAYALDPAPIVEGEIVG